MLGRCRCANSSLLNDETAIWWDHILLLCLSPQQHSQEICWYVTRSRGECNDDLWFFLRITKTGFFSFRKKNYKQLVPCCVFEIVIFLNGTPFHLRNKNCVWCVTAIIVVGSLYFRFFWLMISLKWKLRKRSHQNFCVVKWTPYLVLHSNSLYQYSDLGSRCE